jgi:hypothetical protein
MGERARGIEGNERTDALSQRRAIETCGHDIDFGAFTYGARQTARIFDPAISSEATARELDRAIPWDRMEA